MSNIKQSAFNFLRALRLKFLTASLIPVILGTVIARSETGYFNLWRFIIVILGIGSLHLATNLINDYYDNKSGNDAINKNFSAFSGGSRVIQEGLITSKAIFILSIIFFSFGILIGLYLNLIIKGNVVLFLGIIGVFFGYFYTANPLKIGYRKLGELVVALSFGPLVCFGAYYVQIERISFTPIIVSIPIAILIGLVLLVNEIPDYEADLLCNKKTIVVWLGKEKALVLYKILVIFVYLYLLLGIKFNIYPILSFLILITIPLVYINFKNIKNNEIIKICKNTILLHLLVGIGLIISFV